MRKRPQKPANLTHLCQIYMTNLHVEVWLDIIWYVCRPGEADHKESARHCRSNTCGWWWSLFFLLSFVISVRLGSMVQVGAFPTSLPVCKRIFPLTSFSLSFQCPLSSPVVLPQDCKLSSDGSDGLPAFPAPVIRVRSQYFLLTGKIFLRFQVFSNNTAWTTS